MNLEIYADFHNVDDNNRIRLTTTGTRRDLAKRGLKLKDGLAVTIYMDDGDDKGNRDDLMADAVIRYSDIERCWVAEIDWSRVQNRSERKESARIGRNGSATGTPTPRKRSKPAKKRKS